jgi:transcriptional regulator with XRE-family HTH domain
MATVRREMSVDEVVERIQSKTQPWGITVSYLAEQIGVSRQYLWQIMHSRSPLSRQKALEVEAVVDRIISERSHVRTFGDRLRAARIAAGFTLKEAATMIGYTWVGVERWEKNMYVPKPGVLWHLCNLYGIDEAWFEGLMPATHAPSMLVQNTRKRPAMRIEQPAVAVKQVRQPAVAHTLPERKSA